MLLAELRISATAFAPASNGRANANAIADEDAAEKDVVMPSGLDKEHWPAIKQFFADQAPV